MDNKEQKIQELSRQIRLLQEEELGYLKSISLLRARANEIEDKTQELQRQRKELQQEIDSERMGHPLDE